MISVLYVDDEPSLLEVAKIFLEESGEFTVKTMTSAKAALDTPRILSYDAIISDYQMPGMDGIAFLKAVRERSADIPFILFTGRGREEVVIEAINNGADSYLQKGGDPEAQFAELAHRIWQAVRRKQAERSLHDSERRLSDIIDFLPDATFAIDRSGHVIAWNRAIEEMTGIAAPDIMGKGDFEYAIPFYGERRPMLIDLIDAPDERITQFYTKIYRTGNSISAETDHPHPKGRQILVLAKVCHLYNQAAEITGTIESIRDITERKRLETDLEKKHVELQASYEQIAAAEEELREQYDELAKSEQQIRESETRFRSIIENSPLGMHFYRLTPDRALVFTGANPSADRILKINHTRFVGQEIEKAFPGLAGTEVPDRYKTVAENGETWWNEEVLYDKGQIHGAYKVIAFRTSPRSMVAVFEDITERKQREDELAFKNTLLSAQQETSLDAILIVDENGRIINYNRQFIELWGVPADLVAKGVDDPVLQFLTGRLVDKEAFLSRVKYLYDHKEEKSFEELLLKDERVLERFSAPMFGTTGKYYGRIWYFRDITARKRAEQELRKSEERLQLFIRHAPVALAMFDRGMHYIAASRRWMADYHLGDRDIVGLSHYEVFPEISDDLKAIHRRSLAGEVISADEEKFERKDGSVQWLAWEVRPWYTTDNTIGGIIIFSEDITQRKRAEHALTESESFLNSVIEQSPYSMWVSDNTGTLIKLNQACRDLLRITDAEVVGKYNLFRDNIVEKQGFVPLIRKVFDAGEIVNFLLDYDSTELAGLPLSGRVARILAVTIFPIRNLEGRVTNAVIQHNDITEWKHSEEALRESEEKYRLLTENSLDVIYSMDLSGNITHISPQVTRYGYTPDQLISRNIAEVIAEEDMPGILNDMQTTLATGRSTHTTFRLKGSLENPVWLEDNASVIKKEDGVAVGISGVLRDITERRNAEEALCESEARLRRLADNAPDMIYRMSLPDGRYEYVSPASVAMTGYAPEEFYADSGLIRKLIHPDWHEYFRKQWEALLKNEAPPFYEFQIVDKAGNTRWVNQRNMLVSDENGKPVALEGIVTDINRQKTTERELRRSELRSLALSENAGYWIWEVDPEGVYRYSSPAVNKILGYRPDELVGKMHFYDLFDPIARDNMKAVALTAFESHEPFRDFVNLNRHRNGTPVLMSTSGTPVFDDDGTFTGYCGVDENITEQYRAQEELSKSRQQLAEAMDLANLVNWEYDIATDRFTLDDRFYALYGTSAGREGGTSMSSETYAREFVHPDDRDLVGKEIQKALATTDPQYVAYVEHRIIRRDGEVRYISVRIAITKDASGRTIKTHGANQDITERRKTEEELKESRQMLAKAMDLANVVNWEIDLTTGDLVFNDRFYVLYRTTAEREGGYRMRPDRYNREFVHPEDRDAVAAIFSTAPASARPGQEFQMEHRIIRRDGEVRNIIVRIGAMADRAERVISIHGANQDITERRKAEQAMRESEEKFRSIVETTPDLIWDIDLQGKFRYISPQIDTIMGYTSEEMEGKTILDLVPEHLRSSAAQEIARLVSSEGPLVPFEFPARHRDGHDMVLEIRPSKVIGPEGKMTGLTGVAHDITERKRSEDALRQAQKKLHLLSGITRHDIGNQLLSLNGFVGLLHKKVTDPSVETYFTRITDANRQIASMIAFTKEYEKIGMHAPVWQVLTTVVNDAGKGILPGQILLRNDLSASLEVFADPLIVKVFFNLLDNSIRHGQRVTEIRVSSRQSGSDLVVVWEDNGIGIPREDKELIFGRGFGKNTGLGMFLVREILSLTGITITETGTQPDGARFEIVVPGGAYRTVPERLPRE
jgi:PAS domain S-box-containing protein